MAKRCERAGHLFVHEAPWRIERRNPAGQRPSPAKVTRAPRHRFAGSDSAAHPTSNGLLLGLRHRALVDIDITRQVKDPLDRCADGGLQVEVDQSAVPSI